MGSVSLAVKYRPTKFSEVLGQDDLVNSLINVVQDKSAKAFLFSGPAGTGKTTIARILARELGAVDDSGLLEVDAATYTGIDDIRGITDTMMYRPIGASKSKVYIIDEVHALSKNAFQSLLKSIEEPPAHVYWILCTTDPQKIPTTIKTRCASYSFKPVSASVLEELLQFVVAEEKFNTPKEVVSLIAKSADGSVRQALSLLSICSECSTIEQAEELLTTSSYSPTTIDFCRFICGAQGKNWTNAMKMVKSMEGEDLEQVRRAVLGYASKVASTATNDKVATNMLVIIQAFNSPYYDAQKLPAFLLSIGSVILSD